MGVEKRQMKTGRVVSDKMDKTIVVLVDYLKPHPLYRKIIRKSNKFHAHDEENVCRVGDVVRIVESRPFSKMKRWRLVDILQRAEER
jgi:small subunit ribosomal protein S17